MLHVAGFQTVFFLYMFFTLTFFLFFLQKDFDTFHVLPFKAFLCVFDIYSPFLFVQKQFMKNVSVVICDLLQEKGPSSFAFPTAFRRFQLS